MVEEAAMGLIPLVEDEHAPEAVRASLAAMPPQASIWRLLAHAETVFPSYLQVAGKLQTSLALDPKLRQLAILRVAALAECAYEAVQHEVIAALEGVAPEQIAAIAAGRVDGPAFDEREALVLRFVTESVERLGASEKTTRALARELSPRELVELMLVVGQYLGLATVLKSAALEPLPPLSPEAIRQARARRAALT
jgi:AhpD family alkylhydroperoxidase